jgi:hypothetical protein
MGSELLPEVKRNVIFMFLWTFNLSDGIQYSWTFGQLCEPFNSNG